MMLLFKKYQDPLFMIVMHLCPSFVFLIMIVFWVKGMEVCAIFMMEASHVLFLHFIFFKVVLF